MFGEFIELGDFPHERNIQLATSIRRVEANVEGQTVLNDEPYWRVLGVGGCLVGQRRSDVALHVRIVIVGPRSFRNSDLRFAAVCIERKVNIDLSALLDGGLNLKSSPEAFDCISGEKDAKAHPFARFLGGEKWFA